MHKCLSTAYFLVGPTASGKSSVAQHIAMHSGQMIVSADSMNIYRGMDIGTAKPGQSDREKVDYAGIDLADPTDKFSVADYLEAVKPVFMSRREIIVVGGTGLYIKCLTEGFDDVPPEDSILRTELEQLDFPELEKRAKGNAAELYESLPPDDRKNPRRLIRILEKQIPSDKKWAATPKPVIVGLRIEREALHRRIEQRIETMYASGLLDEAKKMLDLNLSSTASQAIGYAEAFAVLRNELTIAEAKEKTVIRTRQFAKRQMTWFRNQLKVEWIDVEKSQSIPELAQAVCSAWEKHGPTSVVF